MLPKPYSHLPITECHEPLVCIPSDIFSFFDPAPYTILGAPYNGASPWMLRAGVLQSLIRAQEKLQSTHAGWRIKIFDAYRPNDVQIFMVEHEYALQAAAQGLDYKNLTPAQREQLTEKVLRVWAIPSTNPQTPPPHSTGAAIDCTLCDETGTLIDMGGMIDENSDRSLPDYYASATDTAHRQYHEHRQLLANTLISSGFHRHQIEWWHFSCGDQYWAWQEREQGSNPNAQARYGRADQTPP